MAGRNLVQAVVDLEDRLSSKLARVGRSVASFKDETRAGGRETDSWGSKLDKWGNKVHNWFGSKAKTLVHGFFTSMKLSAAIGFAAISAGLVSAFKGFSEFDATLRNTTGLLTGAGQTSAQANRAYTLFSDQVLKLAPELAKKPQDLANSLYDIVSAGFEGAKATEVLKVSAKGASAGMADTATVANGLVKTLAAYGYGADQAAGITDKMFQSVNVGILTFQDMAQGLGTVVGLAATAKVSFSDLMAAVAELTKKGLQPDEAFTSINQMLLGILAPNSDAKDAAAALFGKDVNDKWSAKAVAAKGLGGVMKNLMGVLNPSKDQIKRLNSFNGEVADMAAAEIAGSKIDVLTSLFGNVRALRGALILASGGSYTFADAQKQMGAAAGATDRTMKEQEKTVKRQTDRLGAMFDVLKLQVMGDIAPALGDKVHGITNWFSWMEQMPDFKKAKGFGKVKVLGKDIWGAVTHWWTEHKAAVTDDITKGIDWIASKAVPKVTEWGFNIGKALVPAIWKGMMRTTVGKALVGAVALSWANKLSGGIGSRIFGGLPVGGAGGAGGVGGVEGAAGGAAAAGPLRMAGTYTLLATTAFLSIDNARIAYNRTVKMLDKTYSDYKGNVKGSNTKHLDGKSPGAPGIKERLYGMLPGRQRLDEIYRNELNRRVPFETTTKIKALQSSDGIKILSRVWDDFANIGELSKKDKAAFVKQFLTPNGLTEKDIYDPKHKDTFSKMGSLSALAKQYIEDPSKLDKNTRSTLEFFVKNTGDTMQHIADSATDLTKYGLKGQAFSDALTTTNPILAGVGDLTVEWGLRLFATLGSMNTAISTMDVAKAKTDDIIKWAQALGFGPVQTTDTGKSHRGPVQGPPTLGGSGSPYGTAASHRAEQAYEAFHGHKPKPKVHANALGSWGSVSHPTMFLAGEAGAEDFSFTPHLKGGTKGAGGGGVHVHGPLIGHVTMAAEGQSIEEIAHELADLIDQHLANT